jgi:hypothetical protein
MREYMLIYLIEDLIVTGYTYSDFQSNLNSQIFTSRYVFILGGETISWKSVKQSSTTDYTIKAEYVSVCEAAKEVVWLKKFIMDLGVMKMKQSPIMLFYDGWLHNLRN